MAGKSTSGNYTLRRGRRFRRKFTLDDDAAAKLRELHNLTALPEEEIVRLLILHASGETLYSPLADAVEYQQYQALITPPEEARQE